MRGRDIQPVFRRFLMGFLCGVVFGSGCAADMDPENPPAPTPSDASPRGEDFQSHFKKGVRHYRGGDWLAAESELLQAVQISPSAPEPHYLLGMSYYAGNFYGKARREFEEAIRLDPGSIDARLGLIRTYMKAGRTEGILRLAEEILRRSTDHPEGFYYRGLLAYRRGDHRGAIPDLQRAVEKKPDHIEARYHIGLAFLKSGRLPEAVQAFRETIRRQEDHPGAHQNLARAYRKMGSRVDAERAEGAFREVTRRRDRNREVLKFRDLAVEAYNSGDFDKALAAFREIAAGDPGDSQVAAYLGSTYLALGMQEEAERNLTRAVRLDPRNEFAHLELGRLAALRGDLGPAEDFLRRAIEINPDFGMPHYFLAGIYRNQNRILESEREFAEYRRLQDPSTAPSSPKNEGEYW